MTPLPFRKTKTPAPVPSETPACPEEKRSFAEKLRERGFFTPYVLVMDGIFVVSLLIYLFARLFPDFAEFWARYPSQGVRFLLGKLTGVLHFSLTECFIFSLPLWVALYLYCSSVSMKKDESTWNYYRWMHPLLCGLLALASLFCFAFGPCYFRHSLADNLGLEEKAVSPEQLYDTAEIVSEKITELESDVTFVFGGESVMPYDYDTLIGKINDAYEVFDEGADFLSHFRSYPKPLACSSVFTYTHISGVYTFMTGEANINLNYPDFVRPFTVAHEMAHQRGIAREEEANLVAFLVCIGSEDPYVRYSGYFSMLDYLTDALYLADKTLYQQFYDTVMPGTSKGEFASYSAFFKPYQNSAASAVTTAINDTYLGSQGEKAGTASYGLVVDLAVAYYEKNK